MRRWLVIPSIAIHVGIIIVALFLGAWHIEQLEGGKLRHTVSIQDNPPEEEGGHAPKQKHKQDPFKHKEIPKALVVPPDHVDKQPEIVATPSDSLDPGNGSGDGSGNGSGTGFGSGTGGPCTTDCAKPPVEEVREDKPQMIAPGAMKALWLSGVKELQPPDVTKTEMFRDGKDKTTASFQVCLDTQGNVAQVRQLKSSGYPGYDAALVGGIGQWKYRPYSVGGRGIPVCSVVTFIYAMK